MEEFTNTVVPTEDLPTIDPITFTNLDRKYLKLIFIRIAFFFLLLCGALIAFLFLAEGLPTTMVAIAGGSAIILIIVFSSIVTLLGFPRKGYLVREKDISFQRGIITYKLTTVPYNRIQHVEVNQGVLAKLFKLSTVKIYTAGGSMSDLSIPGLPVTDAQKLKAFLSEKISEHE